MISTEKAMARPLPRVTLSIELWEGETRICENKTSLVCKLVRLLIVASLLGGCVSGGGGSGFYSISGTVADEEGNPIDGVEIVVTGGKNTTTITASGGEGVYERIDLNWVKRD
jgi:hypothetical protein